MKFDIKSGQTVRMEGNEFSNPVIASWITAYIRSLLGELLHEVQKLKGYAVSVTTDGFVTNIEGLESRILESSDGEVLTLLKGLIILRRSQTHINKQRKRVSPPPGSDTINQPFLSFKTIAAKIIEPAKGDSTCAFKSQLFKKNQFIG